MRIATEIKGLGATYRLITRLCSYKEGVSGESSSYFLDSSYLELTFWLRGCRFAFLAESPQLAEMGSMLAWFDCSLLIMSRSASGLALGLVYDAICLHLLNKRTSPVGSHIRLCDLTARMIPLHAEHQFLQPS